MADGQVYVIRHTADAVGFAVALTHHPRKKSVGLRADRVVKPGVAVSGAENDVEEDAGMGLGHVKTVMG